jgi:dsDNA-specific endonuclease/ATPase MutS2
MRLPIWAYIAIAAGIMLLAEEFRINSFRSQLSEVSAEYADYKQVVAQKTREAEAQARAIEKQRSDVAAKLQQEAANEIAAANAAADTAASDADSLRREVDRLRSARRAASAANTPERGQADDRAIGVLAELFRESVRRNQILAEALDRSRIAGQACERIYNGMTNGG